MRQPINQSINQSINQPNNQTTNQPTNQTINQSLNLRVIRSVIVHRESKNSHQTLVRIDVFSKLFY